MTDEMSVDHRIEEITHNLNSTRIAHCQPKRNGRPPISLSDIYRKFLQYYKLPSKGAVQKGDPDSDGSEEKGKGHKVRKVNKTPIKRRITLPNLPTFLKL